MNIVYEKPVEAHAPELYRAEEVAGDFLDGWAALDTAALARYRADGFLVVRGGLSVAQVAAARDELRAMTEADDPRCGVVSYEAGSKLVRKFMTFTAEHPPLAEIAQLPGLLAAAELLGGEPMYLFQEMALLKPAQGREKPWHQDHAYFNLPLDTPIVGAWIALGDVRPENGCMFVLRGGHRAGPRLHFQRRDWQLCDTESLPFFQTAVPMQAGDVLLFDGKLPHGTPINQTDETRWALQYHYIPTSATKTDDTERLAAFGPDGKDVSC
jgi:phytanoyl-CoA hydroxylase